MADFCLDCWNRINETSESEKEYIISKDLSFCEGCGEFKKVIICKRKAYNAYRFRYVIFIFKFLCVIVFFPYVVYRYYRIRKQR